MNHDWKIAKCLSIIYDARFYFFFQNKSVVTDPLLPPSLASEAARLIYCVIYKVFKSVKLLRESCFSSSLGHKFTNMDATLQYLHGSLSLFLHLNISGARGHLIFIRHFTGAACLCTHLAMHIGLVLLKLALI